jgi:hypothetical protein
MKKLLALALTCCIPAGLAAEDPTVLGLPLGTEYVLVIDDQPKTTRDIACAHEFEAGARDCVSVNRAVLAGRMQRVSVRERARHM